MSFFDFTADYKSSPVLPKQEPDPFANYVEPAGDLTTQNFAAWDTPAPANTPAPAATYTPVAQNKWNEQYQAWEDQSGNLWDSSSGLWYSITDPSNPLIYRPEVGWQNVTQYNDYNNELNALGAYSANPKPLGKQISSGDWQNIQSYMDRPKPSPRADFINYDLATSKNVPFPEDVRYSLENADLPYEIRDGAKWYGAPAEGGGLTAPWDKYVEPAAAKLGDAYNWYTKNIQTPISETLSQVTPPALSLLKHTVPGMQLPFVAVDIATGYNPDERILSGATQLGSAIGESGGDPLKFRDIQNENFAERPAWQQLAASTVYDPLNLVGAGLGTNALSSGALEGTGLLSQILRGAAKVDKGIDAAQTAAFGTALKYGGREALGAGAGIGGNALLGGEDETGIPWWQAAALGALSGNLSRGGGALPNKAASALARAQGRSGLAPVLGAQLDDVTDPVVREILGLPTLGDSPASTLREITDAEAFRTRPKVDLFREREANSLVGDLVRQARELSILGAEDNLSDYGRKNLDALLREIARLEASEAGSLPAKVAARGALTTGFGAFGYATADDDASLREKWGRAMLFGAIPAVGPEATGLAAKLYGKIPGLATHGVGRNAVLENAPTAQVLADAGIKPPLHLPEFKESVELPLRTKISNAVWDLVGRNNMNLRANIDKPQVFYSMKAFEEANSRIPLVADELSKTTGDDYVRMVEIDKDGYQLGANGQRMPALDRNGHIRTLVDPNSGDAIPVFAGPRDVAYHVDWYEANGYITPEVAGAIRKLASISDEISPMLKAFKIEPDPEANVGLDGVYISRGQVKRERVPRFRREPTTSRIPSSDKAQAFMTEGESLLAGNRYDHPVEAMRKYAKDQLDKINKANLSTNLSYVRVESALSGQELRLGDLQLDKEAQARLEDTIGNIKAVKKEIKKVSLRKKGIDRDVRMRQRNDDRVRKLLDVAADQSLQSNARRIAAKDAFTLAQSTFDDAASAAKEYLDATAKFAGKNSEARIALTETLDAARKTAREVEAVLKDEVTAEVLDNLHHIDGTLAQADAIRKAVATDIDRLSDRLESLPLAERERAEYATKFLMDKAKIQFGDSVSELRAQKNAAVEAARRETKAVENIRSRITQGKVDELERLTRRRAKDLRETLSYSQELQGRIDELETNLLPLNDHKRELNDIIKQSEVFRREMKESGIPTGYFDASIVGNTWAGVPVPNEIANAVNKYKSVPGAQRKLLAMLMTIYDPVNDVFRFIGATADVSRTAIQGLLGIGENPDITRKAIGVAIKALKDPEKEFAFLKQIEQEMVDEGLGTLARAVGVGKLEIAHAEYLFRGVSDENSMLAALAKKKPLSWFEILFSTPGNAERYLRYQDYMRAAKLAGKDMDDVRVIRDAANAANMVTGRSSHGVLDPIIGERGSSRVLFAGRFVQSQFDTVYNALLVGGIEGEVARRSFLRFVLGGSALTYMINEANGEKTDWRPIVDGIPNPNFARVRVAGHDISLFGPWDSLAKGLISTYQGDPSSFFRSKMAPAAGIIYDLSAGNRKTPLDEPIGFNKETLGQYKPSPFGLTDTIQGVINATRGEQSWTDTAAGAVFNALGLKNSPLSPREKYNKELTEAYPGWSAKDTDGKPIAYARPADPLDDPLFLREYAANHPDSVPGPASALGKELKAVRDEYGEAIKANNARFSNDERTLGEWKAVRHDLKLQQRTVLEPIFEKMQQAFGDKEPEPGTPAAWLDSYMATFENAEVEKTIDFDLLDKYQAEWLKANGAVAQDYIDQFFLAGADPVAERDYLYAMQKLNEDGYFDGGMPRYTGMISGLSDREIDKAKAFISGSEEKHPELAGIKDYMTKAFMILDAEGYTIEQIVDVVNSNKKAFENPVFTIYKFDNPQLVEWLDTGNFYSTLKAVASR